MAIDDYPTARQLEVLRAIWSYFVERGHPPTVRELGARLGIRSTNGVMDHLYAIARKGLVDWSPKLSRTLRLTPSAIALLNVTDTGGKAA